MGDPKVPITQCTVVMTSVGHKVKRRGGVCFFRKGLDLNFSLDFFWVSGDGYRTGELWDGFQFSPEESLATCSKTKKPIRGFWATTYKHSTWSFCCVTAWEKQLFGKSMRRVPENGKGGFSSSSAWMIPFPFPDSTLSLCVHLFCRPDASYILFLKYKVFKTLIRLKWNEFSFSSRVLLLLVNASIWELSHINERVLMPPDHCLQINFISTFLICIP